MPRRQAPYLSLVVAPAEKHGVFIWAMRLKGILGGKSRQQPIPNDLLADVLADDSLRAREQERHRSRICGLQR